METLLVPIDFSENALDAAQYAIDWSPQLGANKVVLYHSDASENKSGGALRDLESVKERLDRKDKIEVACVANNDTLTEGVLALAKLYQASLIVMGVTGRNKVGQKLIGSSVFQISKHATIPVLIIPAKTRFIKIENLALALPMIADLQSRTPDDEIKELVKTLNTNLMIVNVDRKNDKTPKPVLYAALKDIFEMFDDLSPTYHFLTARNTADSVAGFVRDNKAQLLISISGRHGFLRGMFKSSVTKKLAYHSTIPLMIYRSGKSR